MSRVGIVSLLFVIVVGIMVWQGLRGVHEVECEVCITFEGRTECRTGRGRDQQAAIDTARQSACAVLASGREANIKCTRLQPSRLSCD